MSENCLDRHLTGPTRNKAALIWEGEPGEKVTLTYQQLHREVCKFTNVLKRNHVKKGDRVVIYMSMCPEAAVAMLACARIGAIHSVVFSGFSAESIKDRIKDSGAKIVITADGGYLRGAIVPLKKNVDDALHDNEQIERVIVFRRANNEIHIKEGRDAWWHREMEYVDANCPPEPMDSEDPLVHPLHKRIDRQTKRDTAYDSRIFVGCNGDNEVRFRFETGRHLLVHERYRLGHGPQLYCVRPAIESVRQC